MATEAISLQFDAENPLDLREHSGEHSAWEVVELIQPHLFIQAPQISSEFSMNLWAVPHEFLGKLSCYDVRSRLRGHHFSHLFSSYLVLANAVAVHIKMAHTKVQCDLADLFYLFGRWMDGRPELSLFDAVRRPEGKNDRLRRTYS